MPATDRTIRVGALDITLRTSNRTTLGITVTQDGGIIVRGPHGTTETEAARLVERRRSWIYRQLTRITETAPDNPIKELIRGAGFNVLGLHHRLHIVPDSDQNEPLVQLRNTPTGGWLHLRRSTAHNPDKARRILINFYADTGREWLKNDHAHIPAHATNRDLTITFSTRMRTTWAHHHPTRGLTLHWATAQLPPHLLRELIHRTLNLHTIASTHDLNRALRALWLGQLTAPTPSIRLHPTHANHCPSCDVPPSTFHDGRCDVARCAHTGLQRANCHPGNTCNTVWTGQFPGEPECIEYGFYCRPAPGGYEPCNAHDPGAMPDFNRLYRECRWDPATQRMTLPPPLHA